jgi:two-component system sensor histidine kinase KdpD
VALLVEREQLRAAGEREKFFAESDRLHRTLLDSVSHELKTPLSVLRSAGEQLETGDAGKQASLVAEVRTATRRLDHLVANLLNQTRLESGGLKPQLDWCDARDLVATARRAVGDALAGRSVNIEIPADMPLFMADAPLMEQVISNLLLNAALHTPPASPIRVAAGLMDEGRFVFLQISDRGPGVPPEVLDTLFQKFQRGHGARAGGIGLGLSIVRGFMLAQGGEVEVRNNPEGGACFTVRLPFSRHGNIPNDES